MMINDLEKAVKNIKMSEEMKNRIIEKCYCQEERGISVMKFKRIMPLVAIIVICIAVASTVGANYLRGFSDVKKGTAVVGSVFEEKTEMIEITVKAEDNLVVFVNVLEYNNPPYCYLETIDISDYKIINNKGKVVYEGKTTENSPFENGKAIFEIPLEDIRAGKYTLVITEFEGAKKADQPLQIRGRWECSLVK